ncbi:hypothetical protein [Bacillus cereus]|uniref:Uncharacterized protein n=1 Tax=Bacillus cereus HuA2-1 TaxID=1053201 RepID=J8YQ00_BACCE|nr:hypothetical protein [Bacillus cereus]EJS13683.1 hypothetical protein IKS_02807 [Bacillus cereus VDM062]EJV84833.1 hypothetical protein IG3_02443 [Bacillus cereus HuA2-1]
MTNTRDKIVGRTEEEIRRDVEKAIKESEGIKLFGERSKIAITARDIVG